MPRARSSPANYAGLEQRLVLLHRLLMCRYLHGIDIPVAIYLPRERKINPQHLQEPYLLLNNTSP